MTYDLHGQWDYGNAHSFDQCDSGKCIRSHVNLTETTNALSMITKAGVANDKIFVGEASYGRSFHMAEDGCWGPMCDFTGSRTQSEANPGRCTNTSGYLAYAEIAELQRNGQSATMFHDNASSSDIMLYKGDYVSYITPEKKEERRENWKNLNFAGTVDWAVDIQSFGDEDIDTPISRPTNGKGCVAGEDRGIRTGDLCEFTCYYGFCPESMCACTERGNLVADDNAKEGDYRAIDDVDVDINRMCNFACKRNYCPSDICEAKPKVEDSDEGLNEEKDGDEVRRKNDEKCVIWKDNKAQNDIEVAHCKKICKEQLDEAKEQGRTTNYGCIGFWPGSQGIPWEKPPGMSSASAGGRCACDNWLLNEITDTVLEAMPMIAQIGCYIIMSSLKLVLDIGLQFVPGVGKALDAGLDMATTAAQMAAYLYSAEDNPEEAFSRWPSPCGGTELVPDQIKKIFDILSNVADGVSSFTKPKNLKKGSGKKGDNGNPHDQSTPRKPQGNSNKQRKCSIPKNREVRQIGRGKNTIRKLSCDKNGNTQTNDEILVSAVFVKNPSKLAIQTACPARAAQACYFYESVIQGNPKFATLTCPPEAASTSWRWDGVATDYWSEQHNGDGWLENSYYDNMKGSDKCHRDEYPPAYLMNKDDPAFINGGLNNQGQMVRFLPGHMNIAGGQLWKGVCFQPLLKGLQLTDLRSIVDKDRNKKTVVNKLGVTETHATFTASQRPEFQITAFPKVPPPPPNHPSWTAGYADNSCWNRAQQADDPGFQVFTWDAWYNNNPRPYDYKKPYKKGSNGS